VSGGVAPLRVAIAGLGTVGTGTLGLLRDSAALIERRAGRPITVTAVSARDRGKDRGVDLAGLAWHDDPRTLATAPQVDVVCELIGGEQGPALDLVRAALEAGKDVVTANKAMLAHHGHELAARAEAAGRALCFEAAVAGGIPIVKALREGFVGNRVERISGILNGTCNYILSTMREERRDFAEVLADAQALGYAEADPSFDVDGIDAAHKLALLAALAFGGRPRFDAVHIEGIRQIAAIDIAFASELGYRIKLLGVARLTPEGLEQRMAPSMVPLAAPIAGVEGVFNAVVTQGDAVGLSVLEGRGAGARPTASAVVADLVDIARGLRLPAFGIPAAALADHPIAPLSSHEGAYYIRLDVIDRPGVLADVSAVLRDHRVSIESLVQRGRNPDQPVSIVLITHDVVEARLTAALARIGRLDTILAPPVMIRIERA
jgi:homoserine dehydrogenase